MGYNFDEAISVASDSSTLLSAFVYSVIVAPVAEEILCRGIIMKYLEKYGKVFALLITAMLFWIAASKYCTIFHHNNDRYFIWIFGTKIFSYGSDSTSRVK